MTAHSALVERLKAVFVTTVTPYDADGRVDGGRLRANAELLVDAGIEVLVPCGNTGELASAGRCRWRPSLRGAPPTRGPTAS